MISFVRTGFTIHGDMVYLLLVPDVSGEFQAAAGSAGAEAEEAGVS